MAATYLEARKGGKGEKESCGSEAMENSPGRIVGFSRGPAGWRIYFLLVLLCGSFYLVAFGSVLLDAECSKNDF